MAGVKFSPEAVMAAATAIGSTYGHDGAMYCADAERALEAAESYRIPDREALKAKLTTAFLQFRERNGGCPEGPDCAACRSIAEDEADVALGVVFG